MPESKLKLKDLGTIHLMALDATSEFLPFGRPIADYLRGAEGNQNGSRALLRQGPMDFSPAVRWNESVASLLRTTGFGEIEQEGLVQPEPLAVEPSPAETPDPAVADFLPFESPGLATSEPNPPKISPAMAPEDLPISIPRVSAFPLRPRMTFGPPPAPKVKPVPVAPAKPATPAPAAKSSPVVAAPPKPAPVVAPKPAAPTTISKQPAPAPVQTKPATVIPPAPKPNPTNTPSTRVTVPQAPAAAKPSAPLAPAARAPETSPAPVKTSQTPVRVSVTRAGENVASALDAAAAPPKPSQASPKAPTPVATPKPPAPPVPAGRGPSTSSPVEQAPAREVISREIPKEKEPEARPKPKPAESDPLSSFEPNLSMGSADSESLLEKIPMVAKIGAVLAIVTLVLYFAMGKTSDKPAEGSQAVFVGEQGWTTEWASDTGGSRRARQLTMYRPSVGMSDYQLQFVGQIESKSLGWIFRAFDTKNYYAMKIETLRPGTMALTHFAVVEGRESSYSQKPLTVDARPGAAYRVKLDVSGPRFTVSIQGEPVDFWTDNRLKAGSVGFMNERDERGAASSVQFSFPKVAK